jgi:methionyl-tRNA synthetase
LEELPADLWRWWLIANAPESSDDFTVDRFVADVNKDLAHVSHWSPRASGEPQTGQVPKT